MLVLFFQFKVGKDLEAAFFVELNGALVLGLCLEAEDVILIFACSFFILSTILRIILLIINTENIKPINVNFSVYKTLTHFVPDFFLWPK